MLADEAADPDAVDPPEPDPPEPEAEAEPLAEAPEPVAVAVALLLAILEARLAAAETILVTTLPDKLLMDAVAFDEPVMTGPGPMGMVLDPEAMLAELVMDIADEPVAEAPVPVVVSDGMDRVTPAEAQVCWANVRASVFGHVSARFSYF